MRTEQRLELFSQGELESSPGKAVSLTKRPVFILAAKEETTSFLKQTILVSRWDHSAEWLLCFGCIQGEERTAPSWLMAEIEKRFK